MADLAKIKDRIAKLIRMAKDASSPEEAGIAAGRARKLMDEYQISEFEAGAVTEQFMTAKGTMTLKAFPAYMEYLAVQVCKLNDCQAVYSWGTHAIDNSHGKHIDFRGYTSDVNMAIEMYKTLLDTVNRLAIDWLKTNGHAANDFKRSGWFKEGAVNAINITIRGIIQERKLLTATAGTSLVVRKEKEVSRHFGDAKYTNSKGRQPDHEAGKAYSQGFAEGAKVKVRDTIA